MSARVTLLALLCAACTVPALDIEGRPCPCVAGYACDPMTNTCARAQGESCLASAAGAQLYATGFDDFDGWSQGGVGAWRVEAGEALQSDTASDFAYAYRPSLAANDYRIVSTFRMLDGITGTATAVELAARVQLDGSGGQYHCNWDPPNGSFTLMYSSSPVDNAFLQSVYIDTSMVPGFDPNARFTMELQVRGSRLDCCVRGIGGAAAFAIDTRFVSGAPGMKTFMTAAAYDDFAVLAVP